MYKNAMQIPETGLKGLIQNWKEDLMSGFFVFLIALPLCLGIAKASQFPITSGIITAIIGGILVTFFHGSHITIKGPAAGMIVIVAGSVQELGYEKALAVVVVSGIVQILFGIFRSGKLGDFFPSSAVHGMLAAIGVIIVAKQIPVAFGVQPHAKDTIGAIMEIPSIIINMDVKIGIIGIISLIILFCLPLINKPIIRKIPAPMLVIVLAIPLAHYLNLGPAALIAIPDDLSQMIHFPDFSKIFSSTSLYWVVMYALVGSLESLLSTKAVDILDPYKRKSNLDKDLLAVGIGNTLCGFLGALPMISEIVRSSANINNGARTKWSNFFHGMFLLLAILFAVRYINMIPMSALGAMLIFTGYRLASPKVFAETYKVGKEQLAIFVTTFIVTLATDLIIGIFSGIALKLIMHLYSGARLSSLFKCRTKVIQDGDKRFKIEVKEAAIFSNFLGLKNKLDTIPQGINIVIDFSDVKLIDHTVMEHLHHYGEDYERNGGKVYIQGLENLTPKSSHPLSYRTLVTNTGNVKAIESRAKQLLKTARLLKFDFIESSSVKSKFGKYNLSYSRVKYEANVITGTIDEYKYTVSDLSILEGGNMKAGMYQTTVLSITGFPQQLPVFNLTKEDIWDKLLNKAFHGDIDFKEHPDFSEKYQLSGNNEKEIRRLFNSVLIRFLEQNPIYTIECLGDELIIHKADRLLTPEEILDLINFGKGLTDAIFIPSKNETPYLRNIT
ncbi:MAG TPA: SulP family inorganic anion transporter [Cytophagaceae bacterium]